MLVVRSVPALVLDEHASDCRMWSLFGVGCDCGASRAATQRIVEDVTAQFAADLGRILAPAT